MHEHVGRVLRELDLRSSAPWRARALSPWHASGIPDARCLYAVRAGHCEIVAPGRPRGLRLGPGDAVVLPRGEPHRLRSASGPWPDPVPLPHLNLPGNWRREPAAEETRLVCATFVFGDTLGHPALALLPTTIVLRGEYRPEIPCLRPCLTMIDDELQVRLTASELILERLTELVILEALRASEWSLDDTPNWLRAAQDRLLGPVLKRLHAAPEQRWSVAQLAAEADRTRAPFSARFRTTAGVTPRAFLDQLRIYHGKKLLLAGRLGLAEIARTVGFGSARSFSRAFLRATGMTPAAYRRGTRPRLFPPELPEATPHAPPPPTEPPEDADLPDWLRYPGGVPTPPRRRLGDGR
jgi:AraC-like DNA-binding protein